MKNPRPGTTNLFCTLCDKITYFSLFRYIPPPNVATVAVFFWIVLSRIASLLKATRNCVTGSSLGLYLLCSSILPGVAEAFCPHGCICNDVNVDCTGASLGVVPILLNPRVISLTLAGNRITTLQESLIFYTVLSSLDLSNNHISTLGSKNFQGQTILKSLVLKNNSITSFQEDAFFGLTELQHLSLNNNKLSVIENGVFKGLDSLESLHLVNNNIRDIQSLGFQYLSNVKTLNLFRNRLPRVPVTSLSQLKSLQELNFCDNQISAVTERAFEQLINLNYLNLSRNNISVIHPDAFIGLGRLKTLNLLDNRLHTVPTEVFPPLKKLSYLDLSGNLFPSIPRDFLRDLPSLVSLRIERCPRLEVISQDAFVNGWGLLRLSLSQNPLLKRLPPAALAPLLKLQSLDISSCGIEALQPTQIPMRELKMLDISGNPLHCNCSLMWLADVATNHTLAPGSPSCAAPPSLYGVPLRELGSGTCDSAVGPWTIVGCVGVALAGLITILAFLICRWKKQNNPQQPSTADKNLTLCSDTSTDLRRPANFTSPLNNDLPHMQVYSAPAYYAASVPPVQFAYPGQRQVLHTCPSDCPCVRQSPALRPLLRTPSSTPTQSRVLQNKSAQLTPSHFVEFPPPPPTRPPPAISISPLTRHTTPIHHYQYSPYITSNLQLQNNLQHASGTGMQHPCGGYTGSPNHAQLLSTEWLYSSNSGGGSNEDPQHHWYASIDRSSSSCTAAGNESSGYWEEDKEQPTASLLPIGHNPHQSEPEKKNVTKSHKPQHSKTPSPTEAGKKSAIKLQDVEEATPTSYI
uniref:Leucine-rich repeat neuronal protein 4-like n=1 Tax=Hirondellea gigas TaxID=1518452 RepID=A0A6A7G1H5_9CRUS